MRKWIVIMMTAAMVIVSVTGCGGKKTDAASQPASEAQAEAEAQPEAEPEAEAQEEAAPPADAPAEAEQPAETAADGQKEAPADAAAPAGGQSTDAQGETQGDAQPADTAQAGADSTAETAQTIEESRVPKEVRNILVGEWQDMTSQRAGMEITEWDEANGKDFHAQIFWSGSYADRMVWEMDLEFDPASGELVYKGGRKAEVTFNEDGLIEKEDVKWEDAEGSFSMAEVGELRWSDSRQEDAGDFVFVRVYAYDVTAEEFSASLFKKLTGLEEGTAGASLKQAQTAEEILTFAADKQIWNLDAYARTAAITEAWNGLSDEEKALAKRNFDGVAGMIDKAFKDYESVRGTFEDAGVGEDMKALSVNIYARRSFNALRNLVAELQ